MHIIRLPIYELVYKLKERIPFTFARYGDGEWLTILGFVGKQNSNGCTFTKALQKDLQAVLLRNNPYYHTILKVAKKERTVFYNGKDRHYGWLVIQKYLIDNGLSNMSWYDGDVLLNTMLAGKLFSLVEQIRQRRVLYVGNERLRGINMRGIGFFPYVTYIQPPPKNSHEDKARILNEVFAAVKKHSIDFVGWSAGLAAKVFIDETFMKYPGVTQIDFGSSFDGYFEPLNHITNRPRNNTGSRSYIRKGGYDWKLLLKQNIGKR